MAHRLVGWFSATLVCLGVASSATAQPSRGHQLLIEHGFQIHGVTAPYDPFTLSTYQSANYTAINWLWDSNVSLHGAAPGAMPWARWVRNRQELPPVSSNAFSTHDETPYMDNLVALQIGDETNLNDNATRDDYVNWYNEIRTANPGWLNHTILYNNSAGGAVSDAALSDFITRAQPDMIVFDSYRHFQPNRPEGPSAWPGGSPTPYLSDLRRYRSHANGHGIPLGVYRQTFHDSLFRDLSPSELRYESYVPVAMGAKFLTDFTYNTGASSYFTGPGDSNPTPLFHEMKEINRRIRNMGPALVRLTPINNYAHADLPPGNDTNVMLIRGQHRDGNGVAQWNDLPVGYAADPQSTQNAAGLGQYTFWVADVNDPYLTAWSVQNIGTKNDGLRGDVFITWLKSLDASIDNPSDPDDQLYFMITNGLTAPDDTSGADTRQRISLSFRLSMGDTLLQLDANDGSIDELLLPFAPNTNNTRRQLIVDLDGGTSALFKFDPSSPFVHQVPEPAALSLVPLAALLLARRRR